MDLFFLKFHQPHRRGLGALIAMVACLGAAGALADPPAYTGQVQPILEKHCYACHGPNDRKGGLRMSNEADARQGGDSLHSIVDPGADGKVPLIERILATDDAVRMPPKGPAVPPEDIAVLKAWVDAGAPFGSGGPTQPDAGTVPAFWSFEAPEQSASPETGVTWGHNPIDAFLLRAMEKQGLSPSPEADRNTLIRRLSLDLRGLPPTPTEVQAFLADDRPDAWEALVERFLASPHYGERMAIGWLDIARYADTNGYEKDRPRSVWPYRDWVINAFNADMPFDRFVIEQMAGDMLPSPTLDQRIATGFFRNEMLNEEGGIDVEEFRYLNVVDRTNTISTALLGLTMSCAQCHTHKYDPITQREYFQLFAFLNNTDDVTLTVPDPAIEARREEQRARIQALKDALESRFPLEEAEAADGADTRSEEERRAARLEAEFAAWKAEVAAKARPWTDLYPVEMTAEKRTTLTRLADNSILAAGDLPNNDVYHLAMRTDAERITGLRLEVLPHNSLPGGGPGRGVILAEGDFLLTEVKISAAPWNDPDAKVPVTVARATQSFADGEKTAEKALDGRADTGWSIKGGEGKPHAAVFTFDQPAGFPGGTLFHITLEQKYIHQHTIGRFRLSGTGSPAPVASGVTAPIEESLLAGAPDPEADARVRQYFLEHTPLLAEAHAEIAKLQKEMPQLPTTLALEEREAPRVTRIHHRGEFLSPKDAVQPDVPEVLPPLPAFAPRNRLTLARWIVSEDNPLTARVTMNRLWQQFFGRGLVRTAEDFGIQGEAPSHPELLDWLAVEFVRRGWSTKDMVRLMVTSAAYRQSARIQPEHRAIDPENIYLARAPRFRVDAEFVRDIALAASGSLNPEIGGPSVFPPLPEGLLEMVYGGFKWHTDEGPARKRRGMYTYWKRMLTYPTAAVFDAPARDMTCVRRLRTNTPMQALTLLNDEVFMESARAMAESLLAEAPAGPEQRLRALFLRCLAREPDTVEVETMLAWLDTQRALLAEEPADQVRALTGREGTGPQDIEAAAWTLLCRAVLNLDETITRG
ncbi:MAG: PSD1 domain-containing protein [Candidatus Hydrogenedentes bacterium]|nr:PSD1 domain-containing protein [Candidatus Hydrogenedentota bacterium]